MLQENNYTQLRTYSDKAILTNQANITGHEASMYHELALLSHKRQWILFTSQCPRPVQSDLSQHGINCSNIIHMKPSAFSSEEEIVLKAIQAKTASAVVASDGLSYHSKAKILSYAAEYSCKVFFLSDCHSLIH